MGVDKEKIRKRSLKEDEELDEEVEVAEGEVTDEEGGGGGGGGEVEEEEEEDEEEEEEEEIDERKRKRKQKGVNGTEESGVCYLSRIPPHMGPPHVRQFLSKYGEIGKIYLVPEGSAGRKAGKQSGSIRRKSFSEGWVEFTKKKVAESVANFLNGEQIGGRKRSSFYYDIWNIKYLRGFKWDDLISEISEKSHIREQKLNMEISAAKKQRDHYLSNVDKSRALKFIQERRQKKQKTGEESDEMPQKVVRHVHQKQPVEKASGETKSKLSADFLAGVFGGSS